MKSKTFHSLLAGIAVWAGLAAMASAQTVIRIVGSNGDRTATQTAIAHILDAGWKYQGITAPGNTTSSGTLSIATGSNFGAWNGTYQGSPVIIKTSFSGALAGIAAVAGGQPSFRFVASDGTGTGVLNNPLTSTNAADYETAKADFGFSTNFQSTSPYNGVFQGVTYSPVTEEVVGITALGFYASPGFPGSPSSSNPTFLPNITNQLVYQLYTKGVLSLALFTGDFVNDKNKLVYAIGRNTDAGQRYGAYTEVGLGTSTQVRTWFPSVSGTTTTSGVVWGGTVSSHQLWPVNQQPGTFAVPLGSGGYSSGALVAQNLTSTLTENAYKSQYLDPDTNQLTFLYPNATAGYYIGYATPGDGNKGVLGSTGAVPSSNQGVLLKFNGVALTDANVKNGTYTAWVYNRILKPQTGLSGTPLTFANALRDQIKTVDAPAGGGLFDDASVFVQRFTDGGAVVPK